MNNNIDFDDLVNEDIDLTEDSAAWRKRKSKVYVYFDEAVKNEIDQYGSSDTSRELAGVLIGDYKSIGEDRYLVWVKASIKALYTEGGRSNVKFTHETWDYINEVKEKKYKDLKIVGWYHTHPGFGVFLSDYDLFIQNNFFDMPWHVAYVLDPINKKHGFFGLSGEETTGLEFEIEKRTRTTGIQKRSSLKKNKTGLAKLLLPAAVIVLVLLLGAGLLAGTLLFSLDDNENENVRNGYDKLKNDYKELKDDYDAFEDRYKKLEEKNQTNEDKLEGMGDEINYYKGYKKVVEKIKSENPDMVTVIEQYQSDTQPQYDTGHQKRQEQER